MSYNFVDTDYGIGTILSRFDSNYINGCIQTAIETRFCPFSDPKPNMIGILSRDFKATLDHAPDYRDQVLQVEHDTYLEVINMICAGFNLQFNYDETINNSEKLRSIAFVLYDILVSRFTDVLINFYVSYICRNSDSIHNYLMSDPESRRPRESNTQQTQKIYSESKYNIIHANLNTVIYNMSSYDIPFYTLLQYITDPNTAAMLANYIVDLGDIYKNHFAVFVLNPNTKATVLTSVKLLLQEKTITDVIVGMKAVE